MKQASKTPEEMKSRAARLSVASNASLVILKLAVGLAIGSVAVISEAVHSGMDLLAALIALFAVKKSAKPADDDHPFGHGKFENLSGTVEALLIFIAAGWIIFKAAKKLTNPEPLDAAVWGVGVMLLSSLVNIAVSSRLFKIGRDTDSIALQADAWHLRTDVYTSAGVMAGLLAIWLGSILIPGSDLRWLDPLAAILVALLILKAAYKLTIESTCDLLDTSLPPEEEASIRRHISAFTPAVRGFHRLCTRKAGSNRFVEFHVRVDAGMSVDESHRIADMLSRTIKEHYPGTTVTIHIEPCNCALATEDCGCLLSDEGKRALREKNGTERGERSVG